MVYFLTLITHKSISITADEDLLKIWVGNFPYGTTEVCIICVFNIKNKLSINFQQEELRSIFESYKIRSVDLVNTTEAGKT